MPPIKPVLEISDLWVEYDSGPVLEAVNLTLQPCDFLGIIGPNGGGKTTLLRAILGLIKPSRGKILVLGRHPFKGRSGVGYVPQHSLFDRNFPMSAREVVLMGRLGKKQRFKSYNAADFEAAQRALEAVEMQDHADRQIGKLSGGQQQRIFVARALIGEPQLMLLDEPMASVDTAIQGEFYELLARLKATMSVILISHDISALSIYVDKIACLNRRLYYHGSKEVSVADLEAAYQCPIQMIAHGIPHRVLKEHEDH